MTLTESSPPVTTDLSGRRRLRLVVRGAVQGVGFRPFVHRLAVQSALSGWVRNDGQGVVVEVEGAARLLREFATALQASPPSGSRLANVESRWLDPVGYHGFHIEVSEACSGLSAWVRPDVAVCPQCLRELQDPRDRRFRYPFINCTHCGPRFTIVERLPYDRPNTTMQGFEMCPACRAEYEDPADRRFHAQPNACPSCGPQLALWSGDGRSLAVRDDALRRAAALVCRGDILAVKGLGGFHLVVDAANCDAVRRLRLRKGREEKPFAVMVPSMEAARALCQVSPDEARLLESAEAPIVLLDHRPPGPHRAAGFQISTAVAPGRAGLGLMLPYTPLHHLLMGELGRPVVATSGNRSEEPICIDNAEALDRLAGIADAFLVHDRPIVRPVDDSVVRVVAGRDLVLRRARGYAPLPVGLGNAGSRECGPNVLGTGAQMKNALAFAVGDQVFLSQHVGDLETLEAQRAFQRVVADLPQLYLAQPEYLAVDLHPDYAATRFARGAGRPLIEVQHHFAHVVAVMAEQDLHGNVLGVAWDGTGLGLDNTIWGGEFLACTRTEFRRLAHWRTFPLPGGDAAAREPRRAALGWVFEAGLADLTPGSFLSNRLGVDPAEAQVLLTALRQGLNTPRTSSVGRLFDAVAALSGVRLVNAFEGQAAMDLEAVLDTNAPYAGAYPIAASEPRDPGVIVLDWQPLLRELLADATAGTPAPVISARFHNALVQAVILVAGTCRQERVVLTGGCFQNRYLLEQCVARLREAGFQPFWPCQVPPNDGGIALGQVAVARARLAAAATPAATAEVPP